MMIRNFQIEDQNDVRELVLHGLSEHFGTIDDTMNPDLDNIKSHYIDQGHVFLVAEEKGQLIGTAGLLFEKINQSRIVRMSVVKEHRHKGIAQALIDRIMEISKKRRAEEVVVLTEPHWKNAVSLYQNYGFVQFERDEIDIHLKMKIA